MFLNILPARLASAFLAAAVLLAPVAFTPQSRAAENAMAKSAAPEIGKPAPDFTLTDTEGKEHKLSALKGKIVVLTWFNNECPVIKDHLKKDSFNKSAEKFKGKDVVFLLIDSTSADMAMDRATKAKASTGVKEPLLVDADGKVGHEYHAKTTPHVFVIDKQGNLAYAGAIDNQEQKDKTGNINYVDATVEALLAGKPVAVTTTTPYGCGVKYKH